MKLLILTILFTLAWSQEEIEGCLSALMDQDYKRAAVLGEVAVEKYPAIATAHYCLGRAYHRLGRLEEALEHLKKAEELTYVPENLVHIQNEIALVLRSLGKEKEALGYLLKSLKSAREIGSRELEAAILTNVGLIYQEMGELDKAMEYYRRASELGGEDPSLLINLSDLFLRRGEREKALETLKEAVRISKEVGNRRTLAVALIRLGNLYREIGDFKKAEELIRRGIKLAEKIGDPLWTGNGYRYLGWVYADMGRLEEARSYLLKARSIFEKAGLKNKVSEVVRDLEEVKKRSKGQP